MNLSGRVREGGQGSDPALAEVDSALVKLHGCAVDNYKRLDDLRRSVINLRDGVGPNKDNVWPHLLAKFHLVSKTYLALSQNLLQAVKENGLAEYIVLPKSVPSDPDAIAEILRTRLETEIEQNERRLQKQIETEMDGDKTAIEDRIRKYNSYVESVQKEFDMVRKNFEAEGKELAQMDETENKPKGRMAEENLIQIVQKGVMG